MSKFLCSCLLSVLVTTSCFAGDIQGVWFTENKDAKVKVYACGTEVCGDIIWLKDPIWTEKDVKNQKDAVLGHAKTDVKNDDKALKVRPILGMTLLTGLKLTDENEWDGGKIYDAESGKTYSCQAKLKEDGDTLKMKGYIGFSWIGRSTTWTRVE
ncbi:DUF2147 domain-containing protein [Paraglaciecola aquimarina]|uniref:DUF2147 domain-containing protein n=1 Tax=Paraglaciecola algarum TaxID=3050085 RepID=A0ABS9D3S2_9ALTE|nr:DUF2147 domain-containing protein [Paraglaciecola sp. G1-23]MCF2947055.1 DUF2147 domain-containing protein [Paraglaciecola sp. G1-23]